MKDGGRDPIFTQCNERGRMAMCSDSGKDILVVAATTVNNLP